MPDASDFAGHYRPAKFFIIDFILTWGPLWTAVAGIHSGWLEFDVPFMIVAGISAIPAALYMFYTSRSRALIRDFWLRVVRFDLIPFRWWLVLLGSVPLVMGSAVLISLFFGGSLDQLTPSDRMASAPLVLAALVLVFGPLPEELGWHGYGIDSLRSRMNGFWTSLAFGIIWPVWHVPLFFIPDSYQQQLLAMPVPLFFYLFGMIPQAIIMNWIYWHTNRSIASAIIFHFMINFIGEAFQITQQSKSVAGLLFVIIAIMLLFADRQIFWKKPYVFHLQQ
ncbi:CPBP family intramembrane metalloprotease [Proteobacteria bacterium 005FR1]|nr:CPBP family intramembrane metalloprotease [Proteobacteria bacterium 005FR1]